MIIWRWLTTSISRVMRRHSSYKVHLERPPIEMMLLHSRILLLKMQYRAQHHLNVKRVSILRRFRLCMFQVRRTHTISLDSKTTNIWAASQSKRKRETLN